MAGTQAALDAWIKRVAPRAVAYARMLLRRPDAAEDIVQDVFLRLLEHGEYDLLRDGEKLLFRSITNACINAATRRRELTALDCGDGPALAGQVAAPSFRDPARRAASQELMRAVERELRALPAMQRAAVELKAMGGTLAEIAETLQVSTQNAGVLVHRGRRLLKERLGEALPGELR